MDEIKSAGRNPVSGISSDSAARFFQYGTFNLLVERLFRILLQFIPEIRVRDRDHGLGALS